MLEGIEAAGPSEVRKSPILFAAITSAELDGVIKHIDKMRLDIIDEGEFSIDIHDHGNQFQTGEPIE